MDKECDLSFYTLGQPSVPPAITSANSTTFTISTLGWFTVTATGTPTPTLSESGTLPSGISFEPTTGILWGTPASGTNGTYPITFTANNGNNTTQSFTLTVDTAGTVFYYLQDSLGTSRVITTATGAVCYDADFYPFGGERAYTDTCDPAYKFTGKERDSESGLDDFGLRYMSSQYGRFMSPDSIANDWELQNPQTWNRYAYARNNPLIYVDPDGAAVELICDQGSNADQCQAERERSLQALKDAVGNKQAAKKLSRP
jgi:RHS repeat-associated protein